MVQGSLWDIQFNTDAVIADQRCGASARIESPSQAGSMQRVREEAGIVLPGGDNRIPAKCLL